MANFWRIFKKNRQEAYLALDISTESVKALIFKPCTEPVLVRGRPNSKENNIEILGIGCASRPRLDLLNVERLLLGVAEAIKKAQGQAPNQSKLGTGRAKITPSRTILGLGGKFIKGKTCQYTFKRANPEEKISPAELENLIQKAEWKIFDEIKSSVRKDHFFGETGIKLIDTELEEILIDGYKVDNPLDFSGKKVSLKIFNSFCNNCYFKALENISSLLNLENLILAGTPHAAAKTFFIQKKGLEAILVDIGGSSTEVSVIKDNVLLGNFTFNIAAKSFTGCISRALGVDKLQAEQIKLMTSQNKVSSRARESIGKILEEKIKLWAAAAGVGLEQLSLKKLPTQILLLGGGSLLPGLQRILGASKWRKNLPFLKNPVVKIIHPEDLRVLNSSAQLLDSGDVATLALASFFVDLQKRGTNLSKILRRAVRVAAGDNNGKFLAQKAGFSTATSHFNQERKITTMPQKFHPARRDKKQNRAPIKMTDIVRRKVPDKNLISRKKAPAKVDFRPKQKITLSTISSKSFLVFLLISILAVGLALFLVLPRAKLEILPKTEPLSLDLQIIADANLDIEDILAQKIPAKIISVSSKGSETFPATERKLLKQKARGIIQVSNEWSTQSQTLIETTRFLSEEGKLFRTLKTVVVPGAKIVEGVTQPGTIDVEVEAADIGEDYNILPSKFSIPAFKEYKQLEKYSTIYGESKNPMTGGANREEVVVSREDLKKAETELIRKVSEKVTSNLDGQLPQGYKLMEGASLLEKKGVTSSHKEGEMAKDFTVEAEFSLKAIVFNEEILKSFINSLLYSKIPEGKVIIEESENFSYLETKSDFEKKQLKLSIHVEKTLVYEIDETKIKEDLAGKDKSEVKEILSTYTTIERAKVLLWPFWVKKVPSSPKKINIVLTK